MFKVLTLNSISKTGLARLPAPHYQVADNVKEPDAILVRSAKMHDLDIPRSLKAVGRAGAGVNNIPVAKMSAHGVPVFNAPGANANAVKELVIAGLVLGCRHICQAWEFARNLHGFQPLVRMEMFDLTEVVVINHDNTSPICLNTALRSTGSSSPDAGRGSAVGPLVSRSSARTW